METLGAYQITQPLSGKNSGYCVWGFGIRDGREYFIKEFLSPKYPADDTQASPERLERKRRQCEKFEATKKALYRVLNDCSDGNAVRVEEFFRVGAKYYTAAGKINALPLAVEHVSGFREEQRRRICSIIAHAVASIHRGGLVHADLKHDNIMFTHTRIGTVTVKLIDFDSSFLESDPPQPGEEIVGDQVYFSPEAYRSVCGEAVPLTCAMDVFSMGILFHQYLTGWLPGFDRSRFGYPGESVAAGECLTLSKTLPADLEPLFARMFARESQYRPTAAEVFTALSGRPFCPGEIQSSDVPEPPFQRGPWCVAGDL